MRKPPENSRRCCCARRERGSKAAPTRSCATSSPSACSDCPAISVSTRMFRSTRYRPGDDSSSCPGRGAAFFTLLRRAGTHRKPVDGPRISSASLRAAQHPGNASETGGFAMNFDDTPQEATFRAEARKWIDANAPKEFEAELSKSSLGRIRLQNEEIVDVGKAWQKKKAEAGWACLHWPKEYGGRGGSPRRRGVSRQGKEALRKRKPPLHVGEGTRGPRARGRGRDADRRAD